MTDTDDRARLLQLLAQRSIRLGDFVLASGARSSYYIDCRATLTHAEGQALAGRLGLARLRAEGLEPASVGGLTMGADPLAYAIAHASWLARDETAPIHAFAVRKEPKAHGTGRRIEGCFAEGDAVVVIEDVITSGGSALRACEAVAAEGGSVLAVLALVDREAGGREAIEQAGHRVLALYQVSEVLAVARSGSASPSAG
jgi:orotate phosphoribosyltransferase